MNQEVFFGPAVATSLGNVLREITPRNILLVTGKSSYALSGAEEVMAKALQPWPFHRFCTNTPYPEIGEVERWVDLIQKEEFDVMIAVGGGRVLDMAKLIRIFAAQDVSPLEIIMHRRSIQRRGVPLIAIPTTSGSGSQATRFAVVYIDKKKFSVDHEYILPDMAIVDPQLTYSLPPRITAVTGMDALSQAVESFWCVNSTGPSQAWAMEAIRLILGNLHAAVQEPSALSRDAMCRASHLAGQAINITKTTASHALSYAMTSYFGVPHGLAASLLLGEFLVYNSQVTDGDVADARGAGFVRGIMDKLNELLGCANPDASRDKISNFMRSIGLETRLTHVGVNTPADYDLIIDQANVERMENNPRRVTQKSIREMMGRIA